MAKVPAAAARPVAKRVISPTSSEDDDDKPLLTKRVKTGGQRQSNGKPTRSDDDSSSSEDEPISTTTNNNNHFASITDGSLSGLSSESDDEADQPIISQPNGRGCLSSKNRIVSLDRAESTSATTTLTEASDHKQPKRSSSDPSDEDDQPLIKKAVASPYRRSSSGAGKLVMKAPSSSGSESSDDQKPLIQSAAVKKRSRRPGQPKPPLLADVKPKINRPKVKQEKDSGDEDEKPPIRSRETKKKQLVPKKKKKGKPEEGDDSGEGDQARTQEEKDEAQYRWWEETKNDDSKKWTTLEHNGVLFPPAYVPLPRHVKIKYHGRPVDLPPEAEEVAGFFGGMLSSDHVQKPAFCANFFRDFVDVLKDFPPRDGTQIKEFERCDFTPIFDYYEAERAKKRALSSQEKKALKAEKDAAEAKYTTCLLDGRKEKVGNFRVEPPSLFRGRGEHPKTGMLKRRVQAEDITINCSADSKFPDPPPGHQWGEIVHLDTASWLAMWKENINGAFKYVFLAPSSSLKGQSDFKKFEKARNLKLHIERIRADYRKEFTDHVNATRQRATATYLIDRFALRAGNEKGDDEADTFGCCSLRCGHLTLEPPNVVVFDFLGKDSIRFFQKFEVDEQVFKNLRIFKKEPKTADDDVFDRLTTTSLNKHLSDYMPGLTAKVFRTYNASWTFERELEKNMKELGGGATVADKIYAYNKANRQVAVLCNHQRSVSKTHDQTMGKASDKIKAMKYQRMRNRLQLLNVDDLDPKIRKRYQASVESDLDEEWMEKYEAELELREKEKAVKAFEKQKEEAKKEKESETGEKESKKKRDRGSNPEEELERKLKDAESLAKKYRLERLGKKTIGGSGNAKSVETLIKNLAANDQRITAAKVNLRDKDEGKETSLGTSKLNYIDPRLTYAWCKKYEVPVSKFFTKTLREKFTWAEETPADWKF